MNKEKLEEIVNYAVNQGLKAIKESANNEPATVDYLAIFSKDEDEYKDLELVLEPLGEEVDRETAKTGRTFKLFQPLETPGGPLSLIKDRKPDPTRPQRGAPDFKVQNYSEFKDKYLQSSGNFALMVRKYYEMIELKGVDVLVYIPNHPLSERLKLRVV